ncbi:proton-conducting transporter transmembrane domain-containing protein [Streptomonospora wellingtoniae]|uniref:Proton-conducting transporter membrane subunit n=1 Tax=Streptomonospora wellingtoniae TaxID=3075544 RepID=A0ABU2KWM7_9ACTN|nr:proton-conducting transporter membrane subunit [Streptomonospora sp. DSM 45055]MDT0303700.1 proton-conducting transporter membrane subunit [Streptomonospora sp. DSM 45055]
MNAAVAADAALWALVGLPALAGAVLLLGGRSAERSAAPAAVAVAGALAVPAVLAVVGRPAVTAPGLPGIGFGLAVDGLAAVGVCALVVVLLAVTLFSAGEREGAGGRSRYYGLLLVFAAAMLAAVTATDLLTLLMSWEAMGATSYGLIAFHWRDPRTGSSAAVSFLTTRTADLGMYAAAGAALAGGAGGLDLAALDGLSAPWNHVAAGGLLLAALGKSAQLPFSFWLSRAMDGPGPVSALLHSATMVAAGGYLLLRVEPALAAAGWAAAAAAWIGVLTALLMGAVACFQRDLKQLLAASTSAQLGFVVLAAGVGGVAGGAAQFAAHAAVKSLLFLAAGAWLVRLGTEDLGGLRGAARRYPVVGVCFTAGALALGGTPPLSVWAAEDLVLAAAGLPGLYTAGLAASVTAAAYAGVALAAVWARPGSGAEADAVAGAGATAPGGAGRRLAQRLPLAALAAAAVALGALALPGVEHAWSTLLGRPGAPVPGPASMAVSALTAVAALGAAAWAVTRWGLPAAAPGRWAHGLGDWLGLERAARTLAAAPVLAAARGLAAFDDRVLDRAATVAAAGVLRLAGAVGGRVEPALDAAVAVVAAGARRLGALARRPQTGLAHQYYAQAVTVLAAAALLLALAGAVV